MKKIMSVILQSFIISGCYTLGAATGDAPATSSGFNVPDTSIRADAQAAALYSAYNSGSKDTLDAFFREWAAESASEPSPDPSLPVIRAASSLLSFLVYQDIGYPGYAYKYAIVQDEVSVTVETNDPGNPLTANLSGLRLTFPDSRHAIPLKLDDRHYAILSDFLGGRTDNRDYEARTFFGALVPIGHDENESNPDDWALVEHWYSIDFSSSLDVAYVQDESVSGSNDFMCELDENGNWIIVTQNAAPEPPSPPPIADPYEPPPPVDPPGPPPGPHYPHPPRPIPPGEAHNTGTATPPTPAPAPHPRPIQPPLHNPPAPTTPAPAARPRTSSPPPHTQPASKDTSGTTRHRH